MAQPDGKTIAAQHEPAKEECVACTTQSQSTELQSKDANNNSGHRRNCFHGALNCLFLQIMLHFLNTISAWCRQQTGNSDLDTLQQASRGETPTGLGQCEWSVICLNDLQKKD